MNTTSFNEFADICKTIANDLHTMVEVHEYSQYGWGNVSFMTDKFGGIYVCLHYDMKTHKVTNWFGHKNAKEINDLNSLVLLVKREMQKTLKTRNLDALYEFINSQY